jgi:hypothetical protein
VDGSFLTHVDEIVGGGKTVISADDSVIVASVQEAIQSGRSVSFYLSLAQANAVKAWYWTAERLEKSEIKPISREERDRIESELGVMGLQSFRCQQIQCGECDHTYGAFEFLQQGIKEHGLEAVAAIFALKNTSFLRANPRFFPICPNCNQMLRPQSGYEYDCDGYGGCCYP